VRIPTVSQAIAHTFFVSLRKMTLSSTCGQLLHHLRGCDELGDGDEGILHHSGSWKAPALLATYSSLLATCTAPPAPVVQQFVGDGGVSVATTGRRCTGRCQQEMDDMQSHSEGGAVDDGTRGPEASGCTKLSMNCTAADRWSSTSDDELCGIWVHVELMILSEEGRPLH
jgi:hypothetical protein